MPIDPQGLSASFPALPASPGSGAMGSSFTREAYFEDFIYNLGATPQDISGAGDMLYGNPAGIDPAHPGVFYGDVSAGLSPAFQWLAQGNTQGFNLGMFQTWDLEWVWQLNQAPGGVGYSCSMGPNTWNGVGATAQGDLGIAFGIPAGFGSGMATANLFLISNDGVAQLIDTGVTLASIIGTWVRTNLRWDRATGFVTAFLNDVQIATTNTNIPVTLTDRRPTFAYSSFISGAPTAGTRHLFDYIKVTFTMAR